MPRQVHQISDREHLKKRRHQEKIDRKRAKKPWIRANRGRRIYRNYVLVSTRGRLYPKIIAECTKDHREGFPFNNLSVNFSPDNSQAIIQVARRKTGWFQTFRYARSVKKLSLRKVEALTGEWDGAVS